MNSVCWDLLRPCEASLQRTTDQNELAHQYQSRSVKQGQTELPLWHELQKRIVAEREGLSGFPESPGSFTVLSRRTNKSKKTSQWPKNSPVRSRTSFVCSGMQHRSCTRTLLLPRDGSWLMDPDVYGLRMVAGRQVAITTPRDADDVTARRCSFT